MVVKEVPCFQECLDSDDVFIFDAGLELYQVRIFLKLGPKACSTSGNHSYFAAESQVEFRMTCRKFLPNT